LICLIDGASFQFLKEGNLQDSGILLKNSAVQIQSRLQVVSTPDDALNRIRQYVYRPENIWAQKTCGTPDMVLKYIILPE